MLLLFWELHRDNKVMNKMYFAIATFVILICGYLALNFGFQNNHQPYSLTEFLPSDPNELNIYPTNPDMSQRDRNKPLVVFFGDSRAYEWPAIANIPFEFTNRGINGHTTKQVLGRLSAHVANLSSQFVVVQVGVNDLVQIAPSSNQLQSVVTNCKQNIQKIVDQLAKELKTTVILTTIFPVAALSPSQRSSSAELDRAIVEVNEFIRSLKSDRVGDRVIILDAAALLADENGKVRQIYSRDFLHLNENGYTILNTELLKILTYQVR